MQKDSLTNTIKLTQDFLPIIGSLISDPEKLLKYQLSYTEDYLNFLNTTTKRFMNGGDKETIICQAGPKDNRFKDTSWDENTFFYFIKQSYFMTST